MHIKTKVKTLIGINVKKKRPTVHFHNLDLHALALFSPSSLFSSNCIVLGCFWVVFTYNKKYIDILELDVKLLGFPEFTLTKPMCARF